MIDLEKKMNSLITKLFPICRSITGEGVRETLRIIGDEIPLTVYEVPSGTDIFDWKIPDEWNINDAYVKNDKGERVIDFQGSNLRVVGYSIPFEGKLSLDELKNHLHTLPDQPDLIPYVTSYYEKRWGFCLSHNEYIKLEDGVYEVKIDATLEPGSLTYADLVIEGESDKEVLISTYICHPSMANNELSGPVVATYLANYLISLKNKPYYTYRFIYVPETIGTIAYINKHLEHLKKKILAGYIVTCVGDPGPFSYLKTRQENTLVDRVTLHVLKHCGQEYKVYPFIYRQSDERQYNAPGVELPVGSLMRTKYASYPEYHTSADDLNFVTTEALNGSMEMYIHCTEVLECNRKYKTTVLCEPNLGKRGLYPTLSLKGSSANVKLMKDLIAYSDGRNDLLWVADKIGCSIWKLSPIVETLVQNDILVQIDE
jgi:aminopeptidase-like protein|tara:strand:+ start:1755 stop:3041 length:1287 start_codon:yes stop_codon:yes gene_type:complete